MKILQEGLEQALAEVADGHSLSQEQLDELAERMFGEQSMADISKEIELDLRKRLPSKLREERRRTAGFARRNSARWGSALDELEFMYEVAAEMGQEFVAEWNTEINDDPFTFGALNHLHVKGLLTMREIICLIEGGYPDGALARWRTLHEIAVCSVVVRSAGEETAERYLASFDFAALRAAKQLNEYASRSNLKQFTQQELLEMEAKCKSHTDRLGTGLQHDFGWAGPWLKIDKPNLLQLEVATGLDHWRPRYRWASQNVHGGYRPPLATLAMAEAVDIGHSIGASNSGMTDPIHMAAISLAIVATNFLCHWPNADRVVAVLILSRVSRDIGPLALDVESRTRAEARKRPADGAAH